MKRRHVQGTAGLVPLAVTILLLVAPTVRAAGWTATEGELGRSDVMLTVHAGAHYGSFSGNEVEKVDPGIGFGGGLAYRVLSNVSFCVAAALTKGDVDGQIVSLIDTHVRLDQRSGHAQGELSILRFGGGIRLDSFREQHWRYQPFVEAMALWSTTEVTLDQVDSAAPSPGLASFKDDGQLGASFRAGIDIPLTGEAGVSVHGTVEVIEFQVGTSSILSTGVDLFVRI